MIFWGVIIAQRILYIITIGKLRGLGEYLKYSFYKSIANYIGDMQT